MPAACGGHVAQVKYHYQDHLTDHLSQAPPVRNTWYTVFDAEDVRLLWCKISHVNTEELAADLEIRWTIDTNVYTLAIAGATWATPYSIWRRCPDLGSAEELYADATEKNAAYTVDKRGKAFKVEIRMTSVPLTNPELHCWCVRETLEAT